MTLTGEIIKEWQMKGSPNGLTSEERQLSWMSSDSFLGTALTLAWGADRLVAARDVA